VNVDTCIISSNVFCLGSGVAIEFSENNGVVAETASLSFYIGFVEMHKEVFLYGSLGGDQDRGHRRCGSLD
jgi:hypothetical protein